MNEDKKWQDGKLCPFRKCSKAEDYTGILVTEMVDYFLPCIGEHCAAYGTEGCALMWKQ